MEETSPLAAQEPLPGPPRVSILIVVRPGDPPLGPLLEALTAAPDHACHAIAVIDNGARLVTAELEDGYPEVTFRRLPRNFGYTKAVNILAKNATGEYLFFLDPSLAVAPDTVNCLLQSIEAQGGGGAVSPVIVEQSGQNVQIPSFTVPTADTLTEAWQAGGTFGHAHDVRQYLMTPAVMVRKEFVRGMNFFDERYGEFGPLLDLTYQLQVAGKPLAFAGGCEVTRRTVPAGPDGSPAAAQRAADFALGSARYITKREGWKAGLGFSIKAALRSFGQALTFKQAGYHLRQGWWILTGQKIDGTQSWV